MIQPNYGCSAPPPVITWYKAYCIAMAVMYLFVAGVGIFFLAAPDLIPEDQRRDLPPAVMGLIYLVLGLALMVPFAVAPFLSPKPWVWIYGIVMIAIGMTSCCCIPAAVPLLIYWIKPDVKQYFGRPG